MTIFLVNIRKIQLMNLFPFFSFEIKHENDALHYFVSEPACYIGLTTGPRSATANCNLTVPSTYPQEQ